MRLQWQDDEGCQIKGSKVCNMSVQSILDQFPSMQGCVCAWEEQLCASLQMLTTQCNQRPVQQRRAAPLIDWQYSNLRGRAFDGAGSCLKQTAACIHDEVCNKHLVPLVQACPAERCNSSRCQQATRLFYGGMPYRIAEMLVLCSCEPEDEDCLHLKNVLHSGTCGDETVTCQEGLGLCLGNRHCREQLQAFRAKCWSAEDGQCSEDDYRRDECISKMDPALILGGEVQCKMAFLATVGTALQHPCTCRGLYHEDLQKCNLLHDILHNRSHFRK
ncbi:GDNF family receptor alpha-like [Lampris incognitus]|uniref:GDNF family receptor alpha-like n=1 Tax=Lampris incognitus TaxID=2546036 RepID=UPI0024B5DC2A|nr:GDNF family receptor alpha-like [Lampris incognitus]